MTGVQTCALPILAADVRLSEFDALSPTITEVASQAGRYGDLMRVFGTTADLDS